MIDATLNLTRLHCNRESDPFGAEPYLWTVFFHSDLGTLSGSAGLVVTHTPHQGSTTRGMYADGIHAGDDVTVPLAMGEYDVTLDNGGMGLSQLGCLFVLIDERNTDADAIRAGHEALAVAAHAALNALAADKIFAEDKTPTPEEVAALTAQISAAVLSAIKGALNWWDALDQQDRLVGSGHKTFSDAEIAALAAGGSGAQTFSVKIEARRLLPAGPGQPAVEKVTDDYDLFGTLRVREAEPAPDPTDPEKERFGRAVQVYQGVQQQMARLEAAIPQARAAARAKMLAALRHARKHGLPAARLGLKRTRAAMIAAGPATEPAHWCVERDCCTEQSRELYANCMRDGLGHTYCRAFADYHFDRCKHPKSLRQPLGPQAPATRD